MLNRIPETSLKPSGEKTGRYIVRHYSFTTIQYGAG